MTEVNSTVPPKDQNETFLETVIDCITERNTSRIMIN
jgi:hypothetical protein